MDRWVLPTGAGVEGAERGLHYYYSITERGELFHRLLKSGNVVKLFSKDSGKRRK